MGTLLAALAILIAVYLLYVFYLALKPEPVPSHQHPKGPEPPPAEETDEAELQAKTEEAPEEPSPEAEEESSEEGPKLLRNPETGETAAVPTSYPFAKRWIKEALVKEGLLDRIYKTSELKEPEVAERVREALARFLKLKKYWA